MRKWSVVDRERGLHGVAEDGGVGCVVCAAWLFGGGELADVVGVDRAAEAHGVKFELFKFGHRHAAVAGEFGGERGEGGGFDGDAGGGEALCHQFFDGAFIVSKQL
jgi:hypothetical protein